MQELKKVTASYSIEAVKTAIAQTTLSEAQIKAILSAKGLTGETLKTTTAELAAITTTNGLSASQKTATGTTLGFGNALKGLGASLIKFVKSPLGIATIIASTIGIVYTAIKKHNQKIEEAKQKIRELGEEAKNTFSELKSSLESTTTSANEIKKEYAELAQGVKNLGKATQSQGRLSNEEYERFLELGDELSELFPEISTGVDSNGHSINNLSGDITTITSAIDGLVESQKKLVSQEMKDKLDDIWGSYSQDVADASHNWNEAQKSIKSATQQQDRFNQIINSKDKKGSFYGVDSYGTANIAKAFKDAGYNDIGGFIKNDQYDFSTLTSEDIKAINDAFDKMIDEYQQTVNSSQNIIESSNREFGDYLIDSLQGDYLYEGLSDAGKQVANAMLRNFEFDTDLASLRGAENWDEAYEKIKEEVLDKISGLEGEDKAQFDEAWNNLLSIDTDAALAENIPKIEAYIKQIAELLNIDWQQLAPMLGYDIEAYNQELRTAKDRFATNETRTYGSGDHQYTRDTQVHNEVADKWLNGLNEDDIAFIATIDQIDIDETAKFKTEKEFQEWLEKLKNEAGVIEVRTALDTATDLKTSDEAFQKLGSGESGLYADTKSGKQGSASDIEGLTESFKDVSGGLALESFADTLEKLPGDAQAAQEAFDDLTTAYLDQSNVLDDINEANKDYIIEQLKTQGIENAEAFVLSRLNSQVKKNIKAVNEYSTAVSSYSKTLLSVQKGEDGYDDALEGIRTNFEQLYNSINDFKDEQGNEITIPISTDFAEKNLQDLMDLANGSTDALERLQFAAAKEYITHIGVDLPTDQYNAVQQQMNSLMDEIQSNIQDVKVGAYLDNTAAIKALNDLILASGGTAKDVNNILSQMGVDAEVQYEDITMEMSGTGGAGDHEYKYNYTHRAKIPKSVKYIKKPVSGVGAHYTGTSNGSSSGGSGGGGGGSSSDTQKDPTQFDWIETAITRAEESISRLDKVIDNTYQNWFDRNIAVGNKIKQVSNEIDLQQKAYQGYMNKANSIGLADVYKQKVQNGAIQIEDIADENLAKKIEDYKQW